jgi:hypothetical protein
MLILAASTFRKRQIFPIIVVIHSMGSHHKPKTQAMREVGVRINCRDPFFSFPKTGISSIREGMGFRPLKVLRQGGTAGYEQKIEQVEAHILGVVLS